ncbi:glycoside hydrolase family 76 protein [Prauserella oleivorans]|uniref:Glycoside hydrolase family 76 protein n=1 Tax=Prauserella oleivorans TaxID=1478153 RepID=A0ABW5WHR4_9PSEU
MTWIERAAEAERAVRTRHLARLWGVPGTVLGRSGWPPTPADRLHRRWNYWWQAHLLDCLVDAQLRAPTGERVVTIERLLRAIRLRNHRWTNDFYDDMAWLLLALQRVAEVTGLDVGGPAAELSAALRDGWTVEAGGGIRWHVRDSYKNAPTNGPAAIAFARGGDAEAARRLFRWMEDRLVDDGTGLVWDGVRGDTGELVDRVFTSCQGVFLGACLELSEVEAAERTVRAVASHLAPGGVLRGAGGGDGGLFAGILARYLALAARRLPAGPIAEAAARLVSDSASACWDGAARTPSGPLFSPEWTEPAPGDPRGHPARDLSVQIGGWLLLEAVATLPA